MRRLALFFCLLSAGTVFAEERRVNYVPPGFTGAYTGDVTFTGNFVVTGTSDLRGAVSDSGGDLQLSDTVEITGDLEFTTTNATAKFTSAITDATTDSTVSAFSFKALNDIGNTDLHSQWLNSSDAAVMKLEEAGNLILAGNLNANTISQATGVAFNLVASGSSTLNLFANSGSASASLSGTTFSLNSGTTLTSSDTASSATWFGAAADGFTDGTHGTFTLKGTADIGNSDLLLDLQNSAAGHAFTVTEQGVGTLLAGINLNGDSGIGTGDFYFGNGSSIIQSGNEPFQIYGGSTADILRFNISDGTEKARVVSSGAYDFVGVATGSLPTCDAATEGQIQYDTTTKTVKWCNATAWATL